MQFVNNISTPIKKIYTNNYFNKEMNYYICSYGGSGSTILFNYLSNFGNVYHIHDRYPPKNLTYIGKENSNENIYCEWFNKIEIPEDKLKNYKVIFIYRHPIQVIFSRFSQPKGPNINHLQHIKCDNNGDINLFDVIKTGTDLYGLEKFFDNYTISANKNYYIYSIKYELFFQNISLFNNIIGIPDIKELYPIKKEHSKTFNFVKELIFIYNSLINKMNGMKFIEIIKPFQKPLEEEEENNNI
jgi:hypothetical protein